MSKRQNPLLQGARICLRPWQSQDNSALPSWASYADPWSPLWNLPRFGSPGNLFFSFFSLSGTSRSWAIEYDDHQVIGRISLRDIEPWRRRARLGISISESYVGQGIGTESLSLFLTYYFGSFNYTTMLLDVAAMNFRAIRCYERLGFVLKGDEWRQAGKNACLQLLKDPQYHEYLPFFRHDQRGIWVQYLEMELHKRQWQDNQTTHTSQPATPSTTQMEHFLEQHSEYVEATNCTTDNHR